MSKRRISKPPVNDSGIRTPVLTSAQLDKLGERLKTEELNRDSLVALATFRNSFIVPTQDVAHKIAVARRRFNIDITQRPAKSTASIVAKLRREHSRLTQIQDIGGVRLIVSKTSVQNKALDLVLSLFPGARVIDRREKPKSGYRAIHVVVREQGRLIEVQIRTRLQNGWAQYSEKVSDKYGNRIKYGKGEKRILDHLKALSTGVTDIERFEQQADAEQRAIATLRNGAKAGKTLTNAETRRIRRYEKLRQNVRSVRRDWLRYFKEATDT